MTGMGMSLITIDNVSKFYGDFQALANISLTVEKGEVIVVLGPSGSGKRSLIRCANALEGISEGRLIVDGVDVHAGNTNLHALSTELDIVFPPFNLFPHMTISEKRRAG